MRVSMRLVLVVFGAVSFAVACSSNKSMTPSLIPSATNSKGSSTLGSARRPTRWIYVGFSKEHKIVFMRWGGDPRGGFVPMTATPTDA
jgi:hypothetical protein